MEASAKRLRENLESATAVPSAGAAERELRVEFGGEGLGRCLCCFCCLGVFYLVDSTFFLRCVSCFGVFVSKDFGMVVFGVMSFYR